MSIARLEDPAVGNQLDAYLNSLTAAEAIFARRIDPSGSSCQIAVATSDICGSQTYTRYLVAGDGNGFGNQTYAMMEYAYPLDGSVINTMTIPLKDSGTPGGPVAGDIILQHSLWMGGPARLSNGMSGGRLLSLFDLSANANFPFPDTEAHVCLTGGPYTLTLVPPAGGWQYYHKGNQCVFTNTNPSSGGATMTIVPSVGNTLFLLPQQNITVALCFDGDGALQTRVINRY